MNKRTSYHPFAKFFHWTIVVLVAVQFLSGWLMPSMRHGTMPNYFTTAHLSLGLLVIPFAVFLFFMRFYKPVARPEMETATTLIKMATLGTHYLLYALLIVVPLSGWASATLRGVTASSLYNFSMPLLFAGNSSFMYSLARMHSTLAAAIGIVALGHIAAALCHHFVLRDSVLNRMRPNTSV